VADGPLRTHEPEASAKSSAPQAEAAVAGAELATPTNVSVGRLPTAPRAVTRGGMLRLQRSAGNRAVAALTGPAARPPVRVQRIPLEEGPPLAPGNYRYGTTIVPLDPVKLRATLSDMAGRQGLAAEKTWLQAFAADMRSQDGKHSYQDPVANQTVNVESAFATRGEAAQAQIVEQVGAVQTQFQQSLLGSVRELLDNSEKKLQAEGRRYGFPDDMSILKPKPVSAGESAILPSMPASDDLRGVMVGAKKLLDGKKKLAAARATIQKSGPILGDALRPTVLEPAVKEYHSLRQQVCGQFPVLSSIERTPDRLAELASGSPHAGKGSSGPAASIALVKAKEEVRKELADKLSNISVVRDGMGAPDKVDKFWLDRGLRETTKRSMGIAPATVQDAAVEDKAKQVQEDADFEAKVKQAVGVALLVASFVPGVAPVAGAVGLVVGAVDVVTAFQEYYWEEAASGTAMEKAEAISQTEPSLFGLAVSIAFGLLEGVAEVEALKGAINVFKTVSTAYREARAAGVAAQLGSGTAKAAAASELATATERLRTTADTTSGKAGLGDRIVAGLPGDVQATAKSLDASLKTITDPTLKDMVLKSHKPVTPEGETLMDLAIKDPHQLAEDYREWAKKSTKPFVDWLGDKHQMPSHGILNEPAGLIEYGLKEGEARRSFDACILEDASREVGVWRDPATGEHIVVQGGGSFVEAGWMSDVENMRSGKRVPWELVVHHHPNRGIAIDRLPSPADFAHITENQRNAGVTRPVRSKIVWTDPVSKIKFETEFGFTPGAERPWWARYRIEDGSSRIASFAERPGTTGEYQGFLNSFTARTADPVPGGNRIPVPTPTPPPLPRPGPSGPGP
jgi:hypothetical protein